MLAGSGHIAGVINPAGSGKYQHWMREDLPEALDAWLDGAEEKPGSWWETWAAWLRPHSGEMVTARDPAAGPLPAIEPAPGRYVRAKA
jgi:polyhydroxyalkanoate synthase